MKTWKYESGSKTIRQMPENYWIASMDSWDGAVDNDKNARLIAAAPDLLEACKTILNCEGAARIGSESGALSGLDTKWHFDKVRAAIAEAEGGQDD